MNENELQLLNVRGTFSQDISESKFIFTYILDLRQREHEFIVFLEMSSILRTEINIIIIMQQWQTTLGAGCLEFRPLCHIKISCYALEKTSLAVGI
jgi:hypothetical protein